MTRKQMIWARILLAGYLVAVAVLCFANFSSMPNVQKQWLGIPMDKIVHFCMFFPFPLLAFMSFDKHTESIRSSALWAGGTFLAGCLIAAATEWGQARLTTWRSGDRTDFLADFLALAAASLLVFVIDIRKQRRACTEN